MWADQNKTGMPGEPTVLWVHILGIVCVLCHSACSSDETDIQCTRAACEKLAVYDDEKVCPDGRVLTRTVCSADEQRMCAWRFPACDDWDSGVHDEAPAP